MAHIKDNSIKQHILTNVLKGRSTTGGLAVNTSSNRYGPAVVMPPGVGDAMVVCTTIQQYKLTDGKYTMFGMCLPAKYTTNTFGRNCRTGQWFKLVLGKRPRQGNNAPWESQWKAVETSSVPPKYQAAALLLS